MDAAAHLFTAIDHVGIAVPDLDAAIAFYEETYGMRLAHQEVNEEQGVREAMMVVGDSGSHIQLLAPLNEQSTIAKFLDSKGPGIQVRNALHSITIIRQSHKPDAPARATARLAGASGLCEALAADLRNGHRRRRHGDNLLR